MKLYGMIWSKKQEFNLVEELEILFNYNGERNYNNIVSPTIILSNELTCKEEYTIYGGTYQTPIIALKDGKYVKNGWNKNNNKENSDDNGTWAPN